MIRLFIIALLSISSLSSSCQNENVGLAAIYNEQAYFCTDVYHTPWNEYFIVLIFDIESEKYNAYVKFDYSMTLHLNIVQTITEETPIPFEWAQTFFSYLDEESYLFIPYAIENEPDITI